LTHAPCTKTTLTTTSWSCSLIYHFETRVVLAVIRGLLMDLDATGDAVRADHAFHDFLTTIAKAASAR